MKKIIFLLLLSSSYLFLSAQEFSSRPKKGFLENKGQFKDEAGKVREDILFHSSTNGLQVYITKLGISYLHGKVGENKTDWTAVHTILEGASIQKENIVTALPAPGELNYLNKDVEKSIYGVRAYQKITIKNVYPKIDWVIYDRDKGIEHDFIVHPGGNPDDIAIRYEGADLALNDEKNILSINTPFGTLTEGALNCYQTIDDIRYTINSKYILDESNLPADRQGIKYQISNIRKGEALTIDPPIEWATYYGGSDQEYPYCITTDSKGNVYIGMLAYIIAAVPITTVNPGGGAYYQTTFSNVNSERCSFIAKFDNNGVLLWSTFFSEDPARYGQANTIVCDANDNVYIAGTSAGGLAVKNFGPAYFKGVPDQRDAYIARFNPNGVLDWCTYYGGNITGIIADEIFGMDIDVFGNLYVTGWTGSDDLPMVDPGGSAYMETTPQGVFIAKFNPSLQLVWSTYFQSGQRGRDIVTDSQGNMYLGGSTGNSLITMDPGGGAFFDGVHGGMLEDGFIAKFSPTGILLWSTYLNGSTGAGHVHDLDVDSKDNLYVTGVVSSTDFPVVNQVGAYNQTTKGGGAYDTYLTKFNPNMQMIWSTYLGGTGDESTNRGLTIYNRLHIDNFDNKYLTGYTKSFTFPVLDPGGNHFFQSFRVGMSVDAFITQFDVKDAMVWSTFYGGDEDDHGTGLYTDPKGCLFVTGRTLSDDIFLKDIGNGGYFQNKLDQNKNTNQGDAFILKFCSDDLKAVLSGENLKCKGDNSGSVTAAPSGGLPGYTYDWQPGGGTDSSMTGLAAGTYTVTIRDQNDSIFIDSITISEPTQINLTVVNSLTICPGDSATLTAAASGGTAPYNYNWNSGASTSSSYIVKPSSSTKYPVKVTDANGCEVFDTVEVIIGPPIAVSTHNDTTICPGDSINIWANGGSGYSWSPTAGLSNPNIFNPIAFPASTTTYTVTVSSGSCPDITDSITITMGAGVNANVSADITICNGKSTTLTASGGINYSWTPTLNLTNPNNASPVASPKSTTRYLVTVSDAAGCEDTASVLVTVNPSPIVTISGDTVICLGDNTTLTASGGSSYSWSTGDNTPSTTVTPTLASTTYTVTVGDGSGCDQIDSVTVITASTIVAEAGNDKSICSGDSVQLAASGGTVYSWTPATGLSNPNIPNPFAKPTSTTTYTVSVSSGSCTPVNDVVTITVNASITAIAGPDTSICTGDSVQLFASGGTNYSWTPPTGLSSTNIANPIATPATSTTYTVSVSSGNCAADTATVSIISDVLFINANSSYTICYGDDAFLSVTDIPGATYVWSPGAPLDDPTGTTPTASGLTTTTTFSVTATKGSCPPVSDATTINVRPPIITLVSPEQFMCPGDSVQLLASGGTFYAWWPPDGISNTNIATPMASPTVTTIYVVDVSNTNCGPVTDTVKVNVVDTIIANAGADTTICLGDSAFLFASGGSSYSWSHGTLTPYDTVVPTSTSTYTVTVSSGQCLPDKDEVTVFVTNANIGSSGDVTIIEGKSTTLTANGGVTYSWSPATGLSTDNGASITASPTITTTYTISGTDANGCVDTTSLTVTVEEGCKNIFVPTAFSPNNDDVNDVLYVRGECIKTLELSIFNRWGELVFNSTDPNKGWNGTYKGRYENSGVFNYTLKATTTEDMQVEQSGNITLVR